MKCCRPYLERTLKKAEPRLIVVLGGIALQQVLGKKGILRHRGRFFRSEEFNCDVFVTVHPAYTIRGAQKNFPNIPFDQMNAKERMAINDIKLLRDYLKNGFIPPEADVSGYEAVTNLKPFIRKSPLAFDLEWNSETGDPICISLCNEPGFSKVFFFKGLTAMKQLRKIMENPIISKIVANRPVDENKLLEIGVEVKGRIYDVFTMAHLVDENIPNISLENIANTYTDLKNIKDMAEGHRADLTKLERSSLIKYSAIDSDATYRAYTTLKRELQKDKKVLRYYGNFILPVEDMLAKVSRNGCLIDTKKLKKNEAKAKREMEKVHAELVEQLPPSIKKKYKDDLRLTRSAILIDYLFKSRAGLRLKAKFKTPKTGEPSTRAEHLKEYIDHPWVEKYFDWKRLQKITSTYLSPMYDYIHPDGRVYPNILLYRTVTGRTAIVNPPIQQIPQRGKYIDLVLELFVADEGWLFGSRDLSQSEIRIMGWLANEKVILEALEQGIDLHTLTASKVMGIRINKITKEQRQKAKPINFGFLYGMHAPSFVQYAKEEYGISYTLEEAEAFRAKYFHTYPAIKGFHHYMSRVVSEQEFVYTPLGRKRRLPGIHSKDPAIRSMAVRQAINTPIQSFSSDLALLAMKLFQDRIEKDSKLRNKVKILWFKHDEIFFMAREDTMPYAMEVLKKCMERDTKMYIWKHFKLAVEYPIESDGKVGTSWANLKSI